MNKIYMASLPSEEKRIISDVEKKEIIRVLGKMKNGGKQLYQLYLQNTGQYYAAFEIDGSEELFNIALKHLYSKTQDDEISAYEVDKVASMISGPTTIGEIWADFSGFDGEDFSSNGYYRNRYNELYLGCEYVGDYDSELVEALTKLESRLDDDEIEFQMMLNKTNKPNKPICKVFKT